MDGDISISFRREPSYFQGSRLQGDLTQVVKCVDTESDTVVGLGSRSTSTAYVDGRAQRIGYLADLRSIAEYRRGTLLARGYRFLRQLHDADPVPFYVTVIYEGNAVAMRNLVGGRAGLPEYHELGRLLTPAIYLDLRRQTVVHRGLRIARGLSHELPCIVRFLNGVQREKQLSPVYREADFGSGRFDGLRAEDFLLAMDGEEICGTLAVWDQHHLRQTHVERYSGRLAAVRPFYNLAARVSPLRPLPAVGQRIPYVYFSCVAVRANDARIFRLLLAAACNELRKGPWHYAIVGLHEADALASVLAEYRSVPAAGRVFCVRYAEAAGTRSLPLGTFFLEAGCL